MDRTSVVISISLPPETVSLLNKLTQKKSQTRSEAIKEMIIASSEKDAWEKVFAWGRETKEKFNIKSEADIEKLIND